MKHSLIKLLGDFRQFFAGFPEFCEIVHKGKLAFVHDYPKKHLRIIITTPIRLNIEVLKGIVTGLHIQFAVQFENKDCLVIRDSRYINGWEKIAGLKIEALRKLVESSPACPVCNSLMYPVQDKDHQVNPRGTYYVWYMCSKSGSHKCQDTPYRTGLKTLLHRFIVKKY